MQLTVRHEDLGEWTVLRVSGDLDLATAPQLRTTAVGLVAEGRHHLVLDLTAVDFVDSLGLGVLIGIVRRARAQGGDARLVSTRPHLQRTFALVGLDGAVPLHADVDAAVAAPSTAPGPAGAGAA